MVIMWKGYNDPGDYGTLDKANAAFTDRADAGAKNLVAFATDGLQLDPSQTLTIVAHSYGSVVAGVALADDGLRPTNVVVAGSPGMTVDGLSQLHLTPGQFYAEHAPGDLVANNLAGLGPDPSGPFFGGTRLATNSPHTPAVAGHSDYFKPNTQALLGIADVIGGHMSAADVQHATTGAMVAAVTGQIANPAGPLLNDLARTYPDPRLQTLAHLGNALANNIDTAIRDTVDTVVDTADTVVHTVEDWLE